MRLTDFIAEVLSVKNYQKLLINKTRKYQIKQLLNTDDATSTMIADESMDAVTPDDTPKKELNACYFEAKLL